MKVKNLFQLKCYLYCRQKPELKIKKLNNPTLKKDTCCARDHAIGTLGNKDHEHKIGSPRNIFIDFFVH